ncbi:hypothetical protein [Burkholderia sp. MSMB617WGS]|uniref:hypothetical protein n=1 Tax=Burkholderia sp. MSMB617WGS TaxID=1637831 RepID=UPI0011AE3DD7|nr:hypothetical protein [Burkholderia sp. MSMB617WGS]
MAEPLFHNFCGQACGYPEHPPPKQLIPRHFHEQGDKEAAHASSSHANRRSNPPFAHAGLSSRAAASPAALPHRLFHNFCGQACGHPEHPILKPLIQRHFSPHVNEAAHGVGIPLFAQIGAASRPGFDNRAIASANAIASRPFPHFLLASLWIGWASDSQLIDPPTFSRTHQTSGTSAPCSRPCGPSTSGISTRDIERCARHSANLRCAI